ncbi:MAG: flagellar hook-length control protein FliK [Firmicutes bacterium]|nr:flagellar hook-length control protein FliK [Bacillota bacterium]
MSAVALKNLNVKSKDKKSLEGSQIDILFNELFSNLLSNEEKLTKSSSEGSNLLKLLTQGKKGNNESLLALFNENSDKLNFKNLETTKLNNLLKNFETKNLNNNEIKNLLSKLNSKKFSDSNQSVRKIKDLLMKLSEKNNENSQNKLMNELNILTNSKKVKNADNLENTNLNNSSKKITLNVKNTREKSGLEISKSFEMKDKNIEVSKLSLNKKTINKDNIVVNSDLKDIKDVNIKKDFEKTDKNITKAMKEINESKETSNFNLKKETNNKEALKNKDTNPKDILGEKIKVVKSSKESTNTNTQEMLNKNFEFENVVKDTSNKSSNVKHAKLQNLDEISMKMTHQAKSLSEGKESTLKVNLRPKELGDIEIKLNMKNGLLEGKIMVSNEEAKHALEKQLHTLKNQLKTQNIDLQNLDVDVNKDFMEFSKGKKDNQSHQGEKFLKGNKKNETKDKEINIETKKDISYNLGYKRVRGNNSLSLLA